MTKTFVTIIMGSDSDYEVMSRTGDVLDKLGISWEMYVASAHRTPERVRYIISDVEERGARVIIAAAGMAAHLAGVVAAETNLPVVAVPLASGILDGLDALLSAVQMPPGVPVSVMGVGKAGATNAAIFAARILALSDAELTAKLAEYKSEMERVVLEKDDKLRKSINERG